jgi:predicted amidophosphoribosyltransferase
VARAAVAPLLSSAWRRGLDLLFPPRCAGCRSFGAFLCANCLAGMPAARPPRCPRCWMPGPAAICGRCRAAPFAFDSVRAPFVYGGAARDAVHALKYDGVSALAEEMARPMARALGGWAPEGAALVPVPLTGRRRRLRGYNQSELLAKGVSRLSGLPLRGRLLVRRRSSPPQAGSAGEAARRANVAGAFAARDDAGARGPLVLVDDVIASGATLDACARALRAAGYGPVLALTFARED